MISSITWEYTIWWSWIKNLLGRVTSVEFTFKKIGKACRSNLHITFFIINFFLLGFFCKHSRFTGHQGKGVFIFLTPLYYFRPLHRQLNMSRAFTADSSPLHIASSETQTKKSNFFQSDSTKESRGFHFYQIISSNKLLIPKERLLLLLIFS